MDQRKPLVIAVLINLITAGFFVILKYAIDNGLNTYVFVFYRQVSASVLLTAFAIFLKRKTCPPLNLLLLIKLFFHAFLGMCLTLNMMSIGLMYTSATVASACVNSIPVLTFIFAVLLGMESIKLKSTAGIVKLLGVALCLAGTITIALYNGPHINPLSHHALFGQSINHKNEHVPKISRTTWIKGSILTVISSGTWSLWLVLQGLLLREYPSKLILATLECIFSAVQTFFVAIAFERDFSKWKVHLDMGLLAIIYSGVMVTSASFYLQSWCVQKKGPVFMAMSTPLALIFTIICSLLFLSEIVYLGSVLGGLVLVVGLYSVLWGKGKENAEAESCEVSIEDGHGKASTEKEAATPALEHI